MTIKANPLTGIQNENFRSSTSLAWHPIKFSLVDQKLVLAGLVLIPWKVSWIDTIHATTILSYEFENWGNNVYFQDKRCFQNCSREMECCHSGKCSFFGEDLWQYPCKFVGERFSRYQKFTFIEMHKVGKKVD